MVFCVLIYEGRDVSLLPDNEQRTEDALAPISKARPPISQELPFELLEVNEQIAWFELDYPERLLDISFLARKFGVAPAKIQALLDKRGWIVAVKAQQGKPARYSYQPGLKEIRAREAEADEIATRAALHRQAEIANAPFELMSVKTLPFVKYFIESFIGEDELIKIENELDALFPEASFDFTLKVGMFSEFKRPVPKRSRKARSDLAELRARYERTELYQILLLERMHAQTQNNAQAPKHYPPLTPAEAVEYKRLMAKKESLLERVPGTGEPAALLLWFQPPLKWPTKAEPASELSDVVKLEIAEVTHD